MGASRVLERLKIDDPVDAFPVHGAAGVWGVIAVGLFANPHDLLAAYGHNGAGSYGLFMGGGGLQLGTQIVGALAIIAWTCGTSAFVFGSLHLIGKLFGAPSGLRVTESVEDVGMDVSKHGGAAYPSAMQDMGSLGIAGVPGASATPAAPQGPEISSGRPGLLPPAVYDVNQEDVPVAAATTIAEEEEEAAPE